METKIIYPVIKSQSQFFKNLRMTMKIIFIVVGIISLLINLLIGGKMWSLIVIWSLLSLWRLIFSLKLIEFSIYSHIVRSIFYIVILLFVIEYTFSIGIFKLIIPIVIFFALLTMVILFYITYDKKDRNTASIMGLGVLVLLLMPDYVLSYLEGRWLIFILISLTILLFIVMIIINLDDVKHEVKARLFNRN